MSYINKQIDPNKIPQSQKLNKNQVKNDAGGYVYQIDIWNMLNRFLILGTESSGYYVNAATKFERSNDNIDKCLKADGLKTVQIAVNVSHEGRAVKNDQAIFVLARASMSLELSVRKAAFEAVPKVCRIGTHLYQFVAFRKYLEGGWGRLMKDTVSNWFNAKDANKLAYQVAKYKSREDWSARDLLRKAHTTPRTPEHEAIFNWVCGVPKLNKEGQTVERLRTFGNEAKLPAFLEACDKIKTTTPKETISLIKEFNLPREVVPTVMLNDVKVWEALAENMPMTATIRNLGKMTSIGLLTDGSESVRKLANQLMNEDAIHKSRVHPLTILSAMAIYGSGCGVKGSLTWSPVRNILDALEDAFYLSFKNVEPTNKRTMLGLDVSGSMTWRRLLGIHLTPMEVSAAMAMITVRTEKADCYPMAFSNEFKPLPWSRKSSIRDVVKNMVKIGMGPTDCAVPMVHALKNKIPVDTFVIYTDNETWCGAIHPSVALKNYRQKMGIDAKLIVCATESSGFSIADSKDKDQLDIAGFDSATPKIISEFSRGNI